MTTTAERINNAIVTLDWRAPREPAGIRRSIEQLAVHWVSYWNSAKRRVLPPLAQAPTLASYARWYARGWALMPPELREQLVHPRDLDETVWSAIEDQLVYMAVGNEAALIAAQKAAEKLAREVEAKSRLLVKGVLVLAGGATCVLLAYGFARRPLWR